MKKKVLCLVLFLFTMSTVAHAQSAKIDPLKGAPWNVTLNDSSVVTWDIEDTVYVSSSGSSHIGYGVKNPGNVEFEIYWSSYMQDPAAPLGGVDKKRYAYIEKLHADVVDYNDLPQDMTQYTFFTPTGTSSCFSSFTLETSGPYPIQSGARDSSNCDNVTDNCTLEKVIPAKINKLLALAQPIRPFIIIGAAETEFPSKPTVVFDTEAIKPLISLKIGKRIIFAICLVRPLQLTTGDVKVTVGDCTGMITVK